MPLIPLTIEAFGNTDTGKRRARNEDAFLVDEKKSVFAVADGLGGLPEGKLASTLTIDGLKEALKQHQSDWLNFTKVFSDINKVVYDRGQLIDSQIGIGSTLTTAQILKNQIYVGHVGDSGIFLLREGTLVKLTKDHTVAQEIYDKLAEDKKNTSIPLQLHHMLTRCIGVRSNVVIDNEYYNLYPLDKLLMYSDGVTKTADNSDILDILSQSLTPKEAVDKIITLSLDRGAPDNTTAIAIFIK